MNQDASKLGEIDRVINILHDMIKRPDLSPSSRAALELCVIKLLNFNVDQSS